VSRDRNTGEEIPDDEIDRRASAPATVRFSNVGAGKRTWDATVPKVSDYHLIAAIRKAGALGSIEIDVDTEDDDWPFRGAIYVGVFRRVGTWDVLP